MKKHDVFYAEIKMIDSKKTISDIQPTDQQVLYQTRKKRRKALKLKAQLNKAKSIKKNTTPTPVKPTLITSSTLFTPLLKQTR